MRDAEASENQSLYAKLSAALDLDMITEADKLERTVQQAQAAYQQRFTQVMQG